MGLNCSALHYLKAAGTLKKDDPRILGAMGMALSHMRDYANARKAYVKAISLGAGLSTVSERRRPCILFQYLNYAAFEYRQKKYTAARETVDQFFALAKKKGDTVGGQPLCR